MDDNNIESMIKKLKENIPVNEDLKKELRKEFHPVKRHGVLKRLTAAAAALALILTGIITFNGQFAEKASAASLKISNYVSLVDLGETQSLGIAEYDGVIYTPLFGKGLYSYDKSGFHKLYDKEVNSASISRDGKKLVMSANGALQIYDVKSGTVTDILKPENEMTYYEQPSWSYDGKKIIFTKKVIEPEETHGFTVKESGIYEIELDTNNISKIVDGESPSYINGKDEIVLERDNNIIIRKLSDGSETVVDSGISPSVSPDGNYVAYVKILDSVKDADTSKNAKIQESIDNVWVANTGAVSDKKQITSNYPNYFIDPEEWLKGLMPSDIPQVLQINGECQYYSSSWSSDSNSLYVLKDQEQSMRLIRIDFTQEKKSAEDTVKSFVQALIMRNDDYAKGLMKSPPEMLTISNPKAVGVKILSSGKEGEREYVDAEVFMQYTANPYYCTEKSRYYLSQNENGFIIDEIKELSSEEVFGKDDGAIYYSRTERDGSKPSGQGPKETVLLRGSDIPSQYLPQGKYRLSSIYYNSEKDSMVFALQGLDAGSSLNVLAYNIKNSEFELIDSIYKAAGNFLTADNDFNYAALDYFQDGDYEKPRTNVYNLNGKSGVPLYTLLNDTGIESICSDYWDDDRLIFEIKKDGQTIRFAYHPDINGIEKLQ